MVAHAVRMAAAAGCTQLVVTNGCGSTRPQVGPGSVVLISDHLNLTGATPLEGATFVPMGDAYSPRLRDLARTVDGDLVDGVYAQFTGPQYETPAEVKMATILGADLVGMSTALEVIAAREAGLEVLGLSLVTNLAAGIGTEAAQPPGGARRGNRRSAAHLATSGRHRGEDVVMDVSELDDAAVAAAAWLEDDPDPDHSRRNCAECWKPWHRATPMPLPTLRIACRACCSSAPPGCAADSARARTA